MIFCKKNSLRIHMIRHKETSWKCQFCSELFESVNTIQLHLETVHNMNREEIEMLGMLKNSRVYPSGKPLSSCGSMGGGRTLSDVSGDEAADEEETDDEDHDVRDKIKTLCGFFNNFHFLGG